MARQLDPYQNADPYAITRPQQPPVVRGGTNPVTVSTPGAPVQDPLMDAINDSYKPVEPNPSWNVGQYAQPGYVAPKFGNTMGGWEEVNWNDPNMQTPKYVVGRILSNYPSTVAGLQSALADIQRAYPGTTLTGQDILNIPGVGPVDVLQNAGWDDKSQFQWGNFLDAQGKPSGWGMPAAQGGAGAAPGAGMAGQGGAMGQALGPEIMRRISALIGQDSNAVSAQDADISPLAQTHDAALQRALRMKQAQAAEQAAQDGTLGTGGFDADVQGMISDYGREQAGFEAGLVNDKMKERRAQIMQALTLGAGLLDAETERNLRAELARLDDSTRRYGLELANSQFYDNLGLNQAQFESQMNQNIINSLIGGWY